MAKSAKRAKKAAGRRATSARGARTTKRSAKKSAKKSAKSARRSVRAASARRTGSTRSVKTTRSAAGARKTKTSRTGAAKRAGGRKSARKPNAAFMAPVTPSPALAEIVGDRPIPRTEVTKRLWAYIKKHDLQDAKNRRTIRADAALKPIFGGKTSVNMFEMTRLVGQHLA